MKKYRYLIRVLNGGHYYFTSNIYIDFLQDHYWNAYGFDMFMDEIISRIPALKDKCFGVSNLAFVHGINDSVVVDVLLTSISY